MDVTGFGILGTLVIVISYPLVANHRDRNAYQRTIQARDAAHAAELAAARKAHNQDLNGLQTRLSTLEIASPSWKPNSTTSGDLRRAAQDDAATAHRRLYPHRAETGTRQQHHRAFIRRYRIASEQTKILVYANLDWHHNDLYPDQWADDNVYLWIIRDNGDPANLDGHTRSWRYTSTPAFARLTNIGGE